MNTQTLKEAIDATLGGGNPEQTKVDEPCHAHRSMMVDWRPILDLQGGTERMRHVALSEERWLPRFPKESGAAYTNRVASSFLEGFYTDTDDKLVAKPFSKPLTIDEEDRLPETLAPLLEDMDGTGLGYAEWRRIAFQHGIDFGLKHCLVDFTEVPENIEARARGEAGDRVAEIKRAARARLVLLHPASVIAWRYEVQADGSLFLTQVRIKEQRIEPAGDFGEQTVDYVRVVTPTVVVMYRKDPDSDEFSPVDAKPHTFGRVPIVTAYTNRSGFMQASPPLLDLAYVNLDHWQSYSDQRNILHIARVPQRVVKGLSEDEQSRMESRGVSASTQITFRSEKGDVYYVEPQGASMTHGENHLEMLRGRAQELGDVPLTVKGPVTATGEIRAESKPICMLQQWAEADDEFARACFAMAAEWTGEELDEEVRFPLFKDFDLKLRGAGEIDQLRADRKDRNVTQHRYLVEARRRGLYGDDMDPEEEVGATQKEQQAALEAIRNRPTLEGEATEEV